MEVDIDKYTKPWFKIKVTLLIMWAIFLVATVNQEKPENKNNIPLPDPNRVSWGYNFETGEYRYESEYQGERKPLKVNETKEVDITDEDVYDLMDYMLD